LLFKKVSSHLDRDAVLSIKGKAQVTVKGTRVKKGPVETRLLPREKLGPFGKKTVSERHQQKSENRFLKERG